MESKNEEISPQKKLRVLFCFSLSSVYERIKKDDLVKEFLLQLMSFVRNQHHGKLDCLE